MFSAPPDELRRAIDAARGRLGTFADLRFAETVGSTNDVAAQLAWSGATDGTAVLADRQTAGRGRRGRTWSSPAGAGLYLSVILRGRTLSATPGLMTLGAGVAVVDAVLATTGLPVMLKWPNDLVIGAAWKKLGGILCEVQGEDATVIGLGINVTPAAHPPEVAARFASIEGELGRAVDRAALVVECLVQVRALAEAVRSNRHAALLDRWRARAAAGWQGAAVHWHDGDQEKRGTARDIDDDGALLVERDGRRERVIAGEVVWERHR